MKHLISLLIFLAMCLVLIACSKSNEEDMSGNPGGGGNPPACVTTNMKYSTDIAPIIQANCFACHSNATSSVSGFSLEGHANLKAKADQGRLLGAIMHSPGFSPMPQGGGKLSDCNINKIKAWVEAGAPNN